MKCYDLKAISQKEEVDPKTDYMNRHFGEFAPYAKYTPYYDKLEEWVEIPFRKRIRCCFNL